MLCVITTKTAAAPPLRSPAGASLDAWQVARGPQQPAALCRVSDLSAPFESGASVYQRTVAGLPLAGATRVLHRQVCRFFCRHVTGPRRIVAERFPTLIPVRGH